jgi:transketolase
MSAAKDPDLSGAANFVASRSAPRLYGDALLALAHQRPEIVALTADLTAPTEIDIFRDTFPARFFNMGIAEANMIGAAAGMARAGDVPFVHSFCVFVTRRCFDQIAMQVAYPRLNVKLVGFLPGLTTRLGVSHQAIDDVALMRGLPNMTVIEPGDAADIAPALRAAAAHVGPVYLRLRRAAAAPQDEAKEPFALGRGRLLRDGADGAIVATGLMLPIALEAADMLAAGGRHVAVAEISTIKPLDRALVGDLARRRIVVTAENHSIVGGLGSAVAEVIAEEGIGARLVRIGVQDRFAEGASTPYLFRKYGLSAEAICDAFARAIAASGKDLR